MRVLKAVPRVVAFLILIVASVTCAIAVTMWVVRGNLRITEVQDVLLMASQAAIVCGLVGTWGWVTARRHVESIGSFWRFSLGPKPNERPYLVLWRWGRLTLGAWVVAMASMMSLAVIGRLGP
jgi:hypothetical protein